MMCCGLCTCDVLAAVHCHAMGPEDELGLLSNLPHSACVVMPRADHPFLAQHIYGQHLHGKSKLHLVRAGSGKGHGRGKAGSGQMKGRGKAASGQMKGRGRAEVRAEGGQIVLCGHHTESSCCKLHQSFACSQ